MDRAKFEAIREQFRTEAKELMDSSAIYELRKKYLDRKGGLVNGLMKEMKSIPAEEKAEYGQGVNQLKDWVLENLQKMEEKARALELQHRYEKEKIDITIPAVKIRRGNLHPNTQVKNQIVNIFAGMGFDIYEGAEIETDYYNFTALNTPQDHPARDMQDTFYLSDEFLLRTQTSSVQIRTMLKEKPPIAIISPGRVYRPDAVDGTHSPIFHQCEGLVIDKNITFGDLKGTLENFAKSLYGNDVKLRFRPHHFPYTEPSAEVDLSCFKCGGKGCPLCKYEGWIEMLGSGVVHPQVLINCGIDPNEYSGFAFGIGLERIAMMRYNIDDMRLLYENDARFLSQF